MVDIEDPRNVIPESEQPSGPDPMVDVTVPDGLRLRDFDAIIAGLSFYAAEALRHGADFDTVLGATLQQRFIKANPEIAIMVDEVNDGDFTIAGTETDGMVEMLEMLGVDVDPMDEEAIRARVDGDGGGDGGVDIEID